MIIYASNRIRKRLDEVERMGKVKLGKRKPSLMKRIYFQTSFFIQIARIKLLRGWDIVKNPKKVIGDKLNKKIRRMYK